MNPESETWSKDEYYEAPFLRVDFLRGVAAGGRTIARLPVSAGALYRRAFDRFVLGATHRDQPPDDHPVCLRKMRGDGADGQFHPRCRGAARGAAHQYQSAGLSLRRYRRL